MAPDLQFCLLILTARTAESGPVAPRWLAIRWQRPDITHPTLPSSNRYSDPPFDCRAPGLVHISDRLVSSCLSRIVPTLFCLEPSTDDLVLDSARTPADLHLPPHCPDEGVRQDRGRALPPILSQDRVPHAASPQVGGGAGRGSQRAAAPHVGSRALGGPHAGLRRPILSTNITATSPQPHGVGDVAVRFRRHSPRIVPAMGAR